MPRKNEQQNQMCKMKKEHAHDLSFRGEFMAKEQWHKCSLAVHGSI
jgi:hypothetical protein